LRKFELCPRVSALGKRSGANQEDEQVRFEKLVSDRTDKAHPGG
jgi:hypothetical protein